MYYSHHSWLLFTFVGLSECWEDLAECHDDFAYKPPDGIIKDHNGFNWLGFMRYSHLSLGTPHPTSAPRVVLIHRQYVLAVANDANQPPRDYKLNHIVFGRYERTEVECNLRQAQANLGITCGPAYMEIPHSQVITHPEYSSFGVRNSLAIIKLIRPMKSHYMVPICLPSIIERENQRKLKTAIMIDYTSHVPEDFDEETMAKKTFTLLTHKECERYRRDSNMDNAGVTHALCTSGCGIRAGAPIIVHAVNGPFEIIGMSISSCMCIDKSMRSRINQDPPIYIDVYPYVTWITNVIMAQRIPNPFPSKVSSSRGQGISARRFALAGREVGTLRARVTQKEGWIKRVYKVGNYCFKKRSTQRKLAIFYIEEFEVLSGYPSKMNVFARISAGVECTIVCARIALPSRATRPVVDGVGGYNISIQFRTDWFPFHFHFKVGLMGKNTSRNDLATFLKERPDPGYWYKK